jgi:hypothetical protein
MYSTLVIIYFLRNFSLSHLTVVVLQVAFTLLLVCFIQMASFSPIVGPVISQNVAPSMAESEFNLNQRSEADEFLRLNGVTGEEIQEYNRLSKSRSMLAKNRSFNI